MSDTNIPTNLVQLASVDSAKIFDSSILLNPPLLEVIAQRSGFNWELMISVEDLGPSDIVLDYLSYYVLEVKVGPGWPCQSGIGPVVPPMTLYRPVYRAGSKGIAIVGANQTINLDVQPFGSTQQHLATH